MPEIETGPHELRWKRIYQTACPDDGLRVFIDRLWPRGVRKDDLHADAWWKELAPSAELRKWFGHSPGRWKEFQCRYAAELAKRPHALDGLRDALRDGPVTLLTASKNTDCNHALALVNILDNPQ